MDAEIAGQFADAILADPSKAKELARKHPELLNSRWMHDETPLHYLAVEGDLDSVRLLAELGSDANAVNRFGDSPLIDVATLGNDQMAELLLRHGANPNAKSKTSDN